MVAHPDDCVIFAYALMRHTADLAWTVCYLTYDLSHQRAQEFEKFWHDRQVRTVFLGFQDDWHDIESAQCSFDTELAKGRIHAVCQSADIILTHDVHGDYGHPHHCFVHGCVLQLCHAGVITFARPGQGTHQFAVHMDYDRSCLPLHYDLVRGFHPLQHVNAYAVPDRVARVLDL